MYVVVMFLVQIDAIVFVFSGKLLWEHLLFFHTLSVMSCLFGSYYQ